MQNLTLYVFITFLFVGPKGTAQNSFKVEVSGKGQPVLLFPGFTCTSEVFDELRQDLEGKYEVHAFTFAGFGDVPPIEFPWLPSIKEDLALYIQQNDLQRAHLIGHSLGGTLSLWLASENPELSGIIVVDALPAIGAMMFPDFDPELLTYNSPWNQQILEMEEEEFASMALQYAQGMTQNSSRHDQLTQWIIQSDRQTYVYGYTDLLKLDLRAALENIQVPVTLLAATQPYGKEMVAATYNDQYKNLQQKELIFAEDSSHFIMYDRPEWFSQQIILALEKNGQ